MSRIFIDQVGFFPESRKKAVLDFPCEEFDVRTIDGICYVDLSEDFMTKPGKISDEVAVYSVVNSLCELQGITRVTLTVNGNERKNYGKVNINDFMSLKPELIAQEKAGESTGGN